MARHFKYKDWKSMVRRQNRMVRRGTNVCGGCEWWSADTDRNGGRWEVSVVTGGQVQSQGWCTNPEKCGKHERIAKLNLCPACKHLKEIHNSFFELDLSVGEDYGAKVTIDQNTNEIIGEEYV